MVTNSFESATIRENGNGTGYFRRRERELRNSENGEKEEKVRGDR